MSYQTQRDKIKEVVEKYILQSVQNKDLDYNEVLDGISTDLGCSKSMVEDVLRSYISSGKLKEIRILTIPDKEVLSWLQKQKRREENLKEELKEFEKININ